jgi:hypothetical protein
VELIRKIFLVCDLKFRDCVFDFATVVVCLVMAKYLDNFIL